MFVRMNVCNIASYIVNGTSKNYKLGMYICSFVGYI